MADVTFVVIGHKDHGKSTLIGRLLYDGGSVKPDRIAELERNSARYGGAALNFAFLLDSFEEERRDGLTIDVAAAELSRGDRRLTLIDCPGHRELVRNMMTGASGADAALLVVSAKADEGVQEQTRDHVRLARLLGLTRLVCAVTKMDAVGYAPAAYEAAAVAVRSLLGEAGWQADASAVPVVPVSAYDGENLFRPSVKMPWFGGGPLIPALDAAVTPGGAAGVLPLRMQVQDVYAVGGETVAVGRLLSGVLRRGDEVSFEPSGVRARAVSLRSVDGEKEEAGAGENIGIVLAAAAGGVTRGDVCAPAAAPAVTARRVRGPLFVFGDPACLGRRPLQFCFGTALVPGEVAERSGDGPFARVTVRLSAAAAVERHAVLPALGRYIVIAGGSPCAAGIVDDYE